jgi:hypothetical protein
MDYLQLRTTATSGRFKPIGPYKDGSYGIAAETESGFVEIADCLGASDALLIAHCVNNFDKAVETMRCLAKHTNNGQPVDAAYFAAIIADLEKVDA